MENPSCKAALRRIMRQKRDQLPIKRRHQASVEALNTLKESIEGKSFVLSYMPIQSELCLERLNLWLANQKSLVLPSVHGNTLKLYSVQNPCKELRISSWGIAEPIEELCQEISPSQIDMALIPALAFDQDGHRLGFGMGFYDRLLSMCQECITTIGVGFTEQLLSNKIPIESHDKPVNSLALF